MIAVIDSGMGNIGAIINMLRKAGHLAVAVTAPEQLGQASHVILPGVGAFDRGMTLLREKGFVPALDQARERGCSILGICLGMQLLTRRSDEGQLPGLGWISGETVRFDLDEATRRDLHIPNMGWSELDICRPGALFQECAGEARFYFVHSYRVRCDDPKDVLATSWHGHDFVAAFQSGNVMGVQFHPEKSHRFGLRLLDAFIRWRP